QPGYCQIAPARMPEKDSHEPGDEISLSLLHRVLVCALLSVRSVAVVFVNKLIPASENNTIVMRPKPTGISVSPTRKLSGTFQRSAFGSLNRSTKTARAFIAKLQATPNA